MFYLSVPQKKVSKLLGLFLSFFMVFSLKPGGFSVSAAEVENPPEEDPPFAFEISSAIVQQGETVDIIVSMQNNPGFSGLDFDFGFENLGNIANVLPVSITPLNDLTTGIFSSNLDQLNSGANIDWNSRDIITVTWSDADNITVEASDLFIIRFEVSTNANPGIYDLNLSGKIINEIYESVTYDISLGSIEVTKKDGPEPIDFLYGDTYYDDEVEIKDATRLSQFLVSKVTLTSYETLAANVHYDLFDNEAVIDVKDAIKLSQWLADYDGIILGDGPDGTGPGRKPIHK